MVAAAVIGGTIAYFSDTETSTGNILRAGAIDLKIDNESYVTDPETGELMHSVDTSWGLRDLDSEGGPYLFFNFVDLKPGDIGEDTISIHVNNNDAWACMAVDITETPENDCTEPEDAVDVPDEQGCGGDNEGELQNELNFVFWADDGDNVYEDNEEIITKGTAAELFNGDFIALADSQTNVWNVGQESTPLTGEQDYYVGKVWCYGVLGYTTPSPDDNLPEEDNNPIYRGTGFSCNGQLVTNVSQTDGIVADVTFYAEQARNNGQFVCGQARTKTLILENKDTANWQPITESGDTQTRGVLTYNTAGPEFNYTFAATGLTQGETYSLIYYADQQTRFTNWGGDSPGALIDTFIADGSGNIPATAGNIDLGMDLPDSNDWNASAAPDYCEGHNDYDHYNTCTGAKIWLVPSSEYNSVGKKLTTWNPSAYLFETDLIHYNDTNN